MDKISVQKKTGTDFEKNFDKKSLFKNIYFFVKIVKSSRWRQNLDTYIKEMEELSKRKPGYKATMNTYAPCRPIMENLQCVRNKL